MSAGSYCGTFFPILMSFEIFVKSSLERYCDISASVKSKKERILERVLFLLYVCSDWTDSSSSRNVCNLPSEPVTAPMKLTPAANFDEAERRIVLMSARTMKMLYVFSSTPVMIRVVRDMKHATIELVWRKVANVDKMALFCRTY